MNKPQEHPKRVLEGRGSSGQRPPAKFGDPFLSSNQEVITVTVDICTKLHLQETVSQRREGARQGSDGAKCVSRWTGDAKAAPRVSCASLS